MSEKLHSFETRELEKRPICRWKKWLSVKNIEYCLSYLNGKPIVIGDVVLINGQKRAVVINIFQRYSNIAKDYDCHDSGGFMLQFDNGDMQLWHAADEDIEFLYHRHNKT